MAIFNTDKGSMSTIYFMYGGLILFFIYRQFKAFMARKKIQGTNITKFGRNINKWMYIIGLLIIGFGILNIINGEPIAGVLMIALVILMGVETLDSVIFTEEGIYSQGKFVLWPTIKKWAYDSKSQDLVFLYKEDMQEKNMYIKAAGVQLEEMNTLIRKYKLGK